MIGMDEQERRKVRETVQQIGSIEAILMTTRGEEPEPIPRPS